MQFNHQKKAHLACCVIKISSKYVSVYTLNTSEELALVSVKLNLDVSGKFSMYTLKSYLHEATKFDGEFKVIFVLFTIGTMLRPTSYTHTLQRVPTQHKRHEDV